MRVVLDTNVFVSGIHWSGVSKKILYAWRTKQFLLVASFPIIEEISKTLTNFRIPLPAEDILEWERIIVQNAILVEPSEKFDIVKEDPDDNKFIEAAVAGNAEYIITQDKHLLKIKEFKGIKIITPKEFNKICN